MVLRTFALKMSTKSSPDALTESSCTFFDSVLLDTLNQGSNHASLRTLFLCFLVYSKMIYNHASSKETGGHNSTLLQNILWKLCTCFT
jgi:hypothetical protein